MLEAPPGSRTTDPRRAAVDRYVEAERERFVDELRALVRQPSVSATGEGIQACAELLVERMGASGFEARLLRTGGDPLVFGQWPHHEGWPTILLTTHYDVQPAEPLDAWDHPPYAAVLEGSQLWGRGASDAKGPVQAILKAAESLRRATDRPAINLKVLLDGEEEIGSPSLPDALEEHRKLLLADAVVTFDGNSAADGRPSIGFGGGGLLYVELEARTGQRDVHANRGGLVPNALWRLVWALASLKTPDERITIDGFDDQVVPLSEADRRLLDSHHDWNDEQERASLGVDAFLPGRGGGRGPEALHILPIVGLCGLHGGYAGTGVMAVLPHRASAKLYVGMRFAQDPDDVFTTLRRHLDGHGFADVSLTKLAATEPSASRADSPLAALVLQEAESLYGRPPIATPRANWYGRQGAWIGSRLGADAAQVSLVAPPSPNNHAPNEYLLLDYFERGIRYITGLLLATETLPTRSPDGKGPG